VAPLRRHAVLLLACCVGPLGCDNYPRTSGVVPDCPLNIALLRPQGPTLNIGDTLTMLVTSWVSRRDCLPPDTTPAGLRWWPANRVVAIDSMTGHVTALRPGSGAIWLAPAGDSDVVLGLTYAGVLEPPNADSVVTIISNRFGDSARVMLQDADGAVRRWQTLAAGDSTCWVTPLSDSVRYSAVVYVPPPAGPDSAAAPWTTHAALAYMHTFQIVIYEYSPSVPGWAPYGVSPDPGKGC